MLCVVLVANPVCQPCDRQRTHTSFAVLCDPLAARTRIRNVRFQSNIAAALAFSVSAERQPLTLRVSRRRQQSEGLSVDPPINDISSAPAKTVPRT